MELGQTTTTHHKVLEKGFYMGNPRNAPCTLRGTEQRVDIGRKCGLRPIGEHIEDWDAWDWQRYVDGAEIETAQSTRPASAKVSDDNTEGGMRMTKAPRI